MLCVHYLTSYSPCKLGLVISILQTRKQRVREVKQLAQDHRAIKYRAGIHTQGMSGSKTWLFFLLGVLLVRYCVLVVKIKEAIVYILCKVSS